MAEPVALPKRLAILYAVRDKLEQIKQANGFYTDAGHHVMLGRHRSGSGAPVAETLPAIVLNFGRSVTPPVSRGFGPPEGSLKGKNIQIDVPLIIAAVVIEDQDDPLAQVELVIADVKRALWGGTDDQSLGGLIHAMEPGEVEPIPREEGTPVAGAQIEALLKITEQRGEPWN
jgi:hypothetical protein